MQIDKRLAFAVLAINVVSSLALADGKQIFLDKKCNKCHEVSSLGIQKLPKEAGAPAEDEEAEGDSTEKKIDPPDLKGIGAKLRKDYGSDVAAKEFLPKFLNKEVADKEDHKHKKKVTFEPAAMETLSSWLLTL